MSTKPDKATLTYLNWYVMKYREWTEKIQKEFAAKNYEDAGKTINSGDNGIKQIKSIVKANYASASGAISQAVEKMLEYTVTLCNCLKIDTSEFHKISTSVGYENSESVIMEALSMMENINATLILVTRDVGQGYFQEDGNPGNTTKKLLDDMQAGLVVRKQFVKELIKLIKKQEYSKARKLIERGDDGGGKIRGNYEKICSEMYFSTFPGVARIITAMLTASKPLAAELNVKHRFDNDIASIKKLEPKIKEYRTLGDGYDSKKTPQLEELDKVFTGIVNAVCTDFITEDVFAAIPQNVNEAWADASDAIDSAFEEAGLGDYAKADMRYFTEAGLSESYMFNKLNDTSSITQRAEQIIKTGSVVTQEFIEEQYNQMKKTRLSPMVDKVLDAYDNGEIMLIYNKSVHLTIALPFLVMKIKGGTKAVIFISDFSGLTKDEDSLNIEMKKLYTLMEAALVGLRYYTNMEKFARSTVVARLTSTVYAEMSLRILNKEFALSLDKNAYDMINYGLARFYLEKIFGMNSADVIHSYARGACKSPDETSINIMRGMYDTTEIKSIEDLLKFFVKVYQKMDKLTFRYYFERWVSSYAIGATLAIDNFPYLYYAMLSVLLGSFMVNNTALNDLVKNTKGMQHFHGEIAKLIQ